MLTRKGIVARVETPLRGKKGGSERTIRFAMVCDFLGAGKACQAKFESCLLFR